LEHPLLSFDPLPAATRAVRDARRGVPVDFAEGEVGDLEREALLEGLSLWRASRAGHLYLAVNASWPGLFKLGCTRREEVHVRVAELRGAGLPTPWLIAFSWQVYDAHGLEAQAKRACAQWREHGEMFGAPLNTLRDTVDEVVARDQTLLDTHLRACLPGLDGWPGEVARRSH
jgi:hypothetical protein